MVNDVAAVAHLAHRTPGQREADRAALTAEMAVELVDVVYALQLVPTPRFLYLSRAIEGLLGFTPEDFYSEPSLGTRLVHADDRIHFRARLGATEGQTRSFSARFQTKAGAEVWTEHRARAVSYEDGQVVLYGAMRDVSEHRAAEEALLEEQERFRLVTEHSLDVVMRASEDNVLEWVSPSVTTALGWTPQELHGRSFAEIVHPDDIRAGFEAQQSLIRGEAEEAEGEARFLTAMGEWRWMRVLGRLVHDDSSTFAGTVIELRDMQAELATRAELAREIDHDALTGLAKRTLTLSRVQAALDSPEASGLALLCASVDGLVSINEAYTHTAGDRVLSIVAERLISAVGDVSALGRVAGGEFLVVLDGVTTPEEAGRRAQALLDAARGPIMIGVHEIDVSVSIGVAMPTGNDAAELVRDATTAMRQASAKGQDRWEFLDPTRAAASRHRLAVQSALRQAIADDHIVPWFQPVVRLDDTTLAGYEALVRWEGADGAVLEPADFFEAAERSYLITTIDRVVLRRALEQLADVDGRLSLATNVSAATLGDASFFDFVLLELERTGVDPHRLGLEVTETSLVDVSDAVLEGMNALARIGVTWWVDDFGTGYSSISHLRDLPVGGLKLDRSFTLGVASGDERSIRVSQGLAGLASGLNLRTVAEGVQGERDAAILLGQGWNKAQGWYFGRPSRRMDWTPDPSILG